MNNSKLNRRLRSAWFRKDEQEWLRLKSKRHVFIRPDEYGYYKVRILENHFHSSIANKLLAKKWDNSYGGYILKERDDVMVSMWERYDEFSDLHMDKTKHKELFEAVRDRCNPFPINPHRGIMIGTPGHVSAAMATAALPRHDGKVRIINFNHNEEDLLELEHKESKFKSLLAEPADLSDLKYMYRCGYLVPPINKREIPLFNPNIHEELTQFTRDLIKSYPFNIEDSTVPLDLKPMTNDGLDDMLLRLNNFNKDKDDHIVIDSISKDYESKPFLDDPDFYEDK